MLKKQTLWEDQRKDLESKIDKFPFKYFNYGRIGHYTTRYPYKEDNNKKPNGDHRVVNYKRNDSNVKITKIRVRQVFDQ